MYVPRNTLVSGAGGVQTLSLTLRLSWRVVLGSATTGAVPKTLEPFLIVKTLAEVYTIGYRNVGLYKPFLTVCWFLKTDRYFFYSISTDVSKLKCQKSTGIHRKRRLHTFIKFYTT